MGIDEVLTAPHSPGRTLLPSASSECLNHLLVLGERRRYFDYYHRARTHLALDKDAPAVRSVALPEAGRIVEIPEIGGLLSRSRTPFATQPPSSWRVSPSGINCRCCSDQSVDPGCNRKPGEASRRDWREPYTGRKSFCWQPLASPGRGRGKNWR